MINQSTIELLRAMKLPAMAQELEKQIKDSGTYSKLGFEERLGLMVDSEWNRRQSNKLIHYIRGAHFSEPAASIEAIEYHEDRKLDKAQILRFSTCDYINKSHNIILKGASGNGKTYIACALGNAACRKFYSVRYIRMPELLDELAIARSANESHKVLKAYKKVDLLIIDEWLIRKLTQQESLEILELAEARIKKSIIFCTQYETAGWYSRINATEDAEAPVSDAIMDRIVHDSYDVAVEGKISMRERHGLNHSEAESAGGSDGTVF